MLSDAHPGRLTLHKADLLDEGSFSEPMNGCELVIHTASPFLMGKLKDPEEQLVRPWRAPATCSRIGGGTDDHSVTTKIVDTVAARASGCMNSAWLIDDVAGWVTLAGLASSHKPGPSPRPSFSRRRARRRPRRTVPEGVPCWWPAR